MSNNGYMNDWQTIHDRPEWEMYAARWPARFSLAPGDTYIQEGGPDDYPIRVRTRYASPFRWVHEFASCSRVPLFIVSEARP